jgi:hypothetical protein
LYGGGVGGEDAPRDGLGNNEFVRFDYLLMMFDCTFRLMKCSSAHAFEYKTVWSSFICKPNIFYNTSLGIMSVWSRTIP